MWNKDSRRRAGGFYYCAVKWRVAHARYVAGKRRQTRKVSDARYDASAKGWARERVYKLRLLREETLRKLEALAGEEAKLCPR